MASLVQRAPHFTVEEAACLAADLYRLDAKATTLPSERDQNFLLHSRVGGPFVLKIANAEEKRETLEFENQAIKFLLERCLRLRFPRLAPSASGSEISVVTRDEQKHYVRLFHWLEGEPFAKALPHHRGLLTSLGQGLAEMDAALFEFDLPVAHRPLYWDLRRAGQARDHLSLLPQNRAVMIGQILARWDQIDWSELRFSVIHNDASDYNVLVDQRSGRATALLDFGDMVHTATVCEVAIACAYAIFDTEDPTGAAATIVSAYHERLPLTEAEIDVLETLILARLALSVANAAFQTRDAPENEYLNISNVGAWALLDRLAAFPPGWATRMFRYACGRPPAKVAFPGASETKERLLERRRAHLGPSLSLSYCDPLHIVCGVRQYLYDAGGKRYLDCVNNVAHVGHSHPRVVNAAAKQMELLNTNTRYVHELLVAFIERLTQTLPESLSVVFVVSSGSEANELALRLARSQTGSDQIIVLDHAYHGNTNSLIDISPYKFDGPGGRGCPPHVHVVPMPDHYRGAHRGADAGHAYALSVADRIAQLDRPATFISESALSCGGQIILPDGYLAEAYAAVRAGGGVCVADEVQTGFGRAGTDFWMFETQGVVPEIVTLGKPIGNGHPLGAVVTTRKIADQFANGMEYFNTFGGNPVSCAVGLAVLDVLRDEELQSNALEVGNYLKTELQKLQEVFPVIGDVRGRGLFLGIDLVRGPENLEPAAKEAAEIIERMRDRGVLLSTDGPFHNVIKIKPPMIFSRCDADFFVGELRKVLAQGGF